MAVVLPLTGSAALFDAARAWTLVEEAINDAGGIGGRELKVRTFDTPLSDPNDLSPVVDGFSQVAAQGFKYIISLIAGETVEPIMQEAMSQGILAMSLVAEQREKNLPEYNGMLLRAVFSSDRVVQEQAEVLQQRGEKQLVLIGPADKNGDVDPRHKNLQQAFTQCSDCQVSSISYPSEADPYFYDWASLGERAMAEEPTAVFLSGTDYQALMDSVYVLESRGYEGLYYFAYSGFMAGLIPVFWDTAAPRFRAFELAIPETAVLSEFRNVFSDRYELEFVPEPRLLAAADCLGLLSLALAEEGDEEPTAVARAMRQISAAEGAVVGPLDFGRAAEVLQSEGSVDYVGLSGPLDFNSLGDVTDGLVVEYEVTSEGQLQIREL